MKIKNSIIHEMFGILQLALLLAMMIGSLFFWYRPLDTHFLSQYCQASLLLRICSYAVFGWGLFLWIDSVIILRVYGKGSPHPSINPTQKLVQRGPYRYFPHPIYAGFICIFFSRALGVLSPSLFMMGILITLVINRFVIPWEEKHNRERFGYHYDNYRTEIDRRWMRAFSGGYKQLGFIFLVIVISLGVFNLTVLAPKVPTPIFGAQVNTWIVFGIGSLLIFIGTVFFFGALACFFIMGPGLKTNGPYRLVRNPMYSGFFHAYIGTSLLLSSWYCLLFTPALTGIAYFYVVMIKERRQLAQHGQAFVVYCEKVNRFFYYGLLLNGRRPDRSAETAGIKVHHE